MTKKKALGTATQLVHFGDNPVLGNTRPDVIPIYQTAAFVLKDLDTINAVHNDPGRGGYFYSRSGNPNQTGLAEVVAAAEEAEAGAVCASGMAALVAGILAVVQAGDHILAADNLYGLTYTLLKKDLAKLGIESSFVDLNDPEVVRAATRPNTKLFLTEVCTNPFVKVYDIDAIGEAAHAIGAKVLVDNTFTTPVHIKPLQHGADIVMHSTTKYFGGHNDVTGGAVVADGPTINEVKRLISTFGSSLSSFDAWLLQRGARTMSLRVKQQSANALVIAEALAQHPKVAKVFYPGLKDNPQYALATRLLTNGYGAMLSFYLPDDEAKVNQFIQHLNLIKFVTTLGGVRTILSHPATTSHHGLTPEERKNQGIHTGLIRLSVGIEEAADLIDDLYGALESI